MSKLFSCASGRSNRKRVDLPPPEPKAKRNFWEIDGYTNAIDRCNQGHTLTTNVISMFTERAQIEEEYAKKLKDWQDKWHEKVDSSAEYKSTKNCIQSCLNTGTKVAEIHLSLAAKLTEKVKSPIAELKKWLDSNYEVSYINYKKAKEFNKSFEHAQEPWKEYLAKLKKFENEYHGSVKNSIESENSAKKVETNQSKTQDQKREARQQAEIAVSNQKIAKSRYEEHLKSMDVFKTSYLEDMKHVFAKTQTFEKERIEYTKVILNKLNDCFLNFFEDAKYKEIFKLAGVDIGNINADEDLKWWSKIYGVDMIPIWPTFQEFNY
jgi:hypothetical protein